MKPSNPLFPWGIRLLGILLCCRCLEVATGEEADTGLFRLQHDGLLRCSKPAASMRAIGKSLMLYDDFELSVDGQFQMIGSSRLVRQPGNGPGKPFQTEPACVSIVALGNVRLKFPETGETFVARTAVFRMSERSWILDGVPLKRSCGPRTNRAARISSGMALGRNLSAMSASD